MGTLYKHGEKWRAQVKRIGHPSVSRVCDTKTEAQKWMRAVEREMDQGTFAAPSKVTAKEIFERYRDKVTPKKKGARWEKTRINKLLRDCPFLKKPCSNISQQDLIRWRDKRLEEVKADSVHREMTVLSTVFTHAMKEWQLRLPANPVHLVKRPKRGKKRNRRPRGDELARITEVCEKSRGALVNKLPALVELAIETGMRLGELCAIETLDINLEARWVHLKDTKNGTDRYVPLTDKAAEIIEQLKPAEGPLLPNSADTVGAVWRKVRKKAGVKDLRIHDLRHEAATRISDKVGPLDLAKIFGWKRMDEALTYYNPTPEELAAKLNKKAPTEAGAS